MNNDSGIDHDLFFKNLSTRYIGKLLMCANTVTSTQTIMMEYPKILNIKINRIIMLLKLL